MELGTIYLVSIKKRMRQYKELAEKAMSQLEQDQLFEIPGQDNNSIALIVQHVAGNMLSRWTNFLTTDGEKEWRNRDDEFIPVLKTRSEVDAQWNKGWNCFLQALDELKPEQLMNRIYIRGEALTVIDALNRQIAHYPYHVGQIVFFAKMLKKDPWESLSIPKKK